MVVCREGEGGEEGEEEDGDGDGGEAHVEVVCVCVCVCGRSDVASWRDGVSVDTLRVFLGVRAKARHQIKA